MGIKEHKEEKDKLSFYLPWIFLVDKGVILNKNGTLQKTYKYRGHDYDSLTENSLDTITTKLNNVIKRLDTGWSLHIDSIREKSNFYKKGNFNNLSGQIIDEEREEYFNQGNHYESNYYITLTQLQPLDLTKNVDKIFISTNQSKDKKKNNFEEQLIKFNKMNKDVINLLQEAFLEVKELDDEETYTYLHNLISDKKLDKITVPEVAIPIANYLADSELIGGLKPVLGKKHLRVISLQGFPQYSNINFFENLNKLDIEYRWSTRFVSLSKNEALSILKKKWNTTFQGRFSILQRVMQEFSPDKNQQHKENRNALENAEDIKSQMDLVRGDYISQGYYTCSIILSDESLDLIEKKVEIIVKTINNLGFTTIVESVNTIEAYLGSLAGNISSNLRKPILNSITLSHLLPVSSIWSGNEINKHFNDIPLLYTTTNGYTPFKFNLHVGEVGHTSIVGQTGSGKSVLLGLLASQFQKYKNSKIYFFDKDSSSRVLTYSVGGQFYDLGEENLNFQPLQNIDHNTDLEWANGWIEDIFIQEGLNLNPSQKEKINEALKLVSELPVKMRTLTSFKSLLTDEELQEALIPFVYGGVQGRYFDNDNKNLSTNWWQVFEMGKIISNKQVLIPLLNYLFFKIEKSLDGSPTIIILDECWMFFDNPIFSAKIREWLKVLRKKNTSVVFATQELADIKKSAIFTTILDSCNTKIFLPNPNANSNNYIEIYKEFGLNEKEIEIISNATLKKDYYVKSPEGARKFELALGANSLKLIASSDIELQKKAIKIYEQNNKADDFTKTWLSSFQF